MAVYSKDIFTAYFPIYATDIHLLPSEIGITLAIVAISAAAVRLFQFSLVKRFSRHVITAVCMFVAGSAFALTPFVNLPISLYLLGALLGLGLGIVQPLSFVYLMNFAPCGREGEVIGMRSMFNRISQLTAPLLFGMIGGSLGLNPIFWFCGLTLIAGSWYSRDASMKNAPQV